MTVTWYMIPEIWSATNRMFCHFGLLFALYPLSSQKNENFKNLNKKGLEISTFYTYIPKIMIICYTVPKIWCVTDAIVIFHFGIFLPFYPLNCPKNEYFKKMKKKTPGDSSFYQKLWLWCATDGRKDGKSDIYRWVSHLKKIKSQKMFFPILVLPIVRVTCDWLKNGYVVILLPTCPFLYFPISCERLKKLSTSPRLLVDQKILESNLLKYYTDRMTTMSSKFSFFDKIIKKKLYSPFLWMGFNCLKVRATSRRQFTFYH